MKTTRRDKELFESQHYNRKLARPLTFPFSRSFSSPLNGRGFDLDASAYLALLSGDGVSVSGAQAAAINDFFVTGKSEGWYSELVRFYLPIWDAAAPNAICMVSGTSGTFNGAITHHPGYAMGGGAASASFDTGYQLLDDLTIEDACLMGLAYDDDLIGPPSGERAMVGTNQALIGAGATTATSIRVGSGNSSITQKIAWLGATVTSSTNGTHGVMLSNRLGGTTTLSRRNSSTLYEQTNTASLTGTYSNYNIRGFGSGTSSSLSQPTTAKAGAFGISGGLDDTQRSDYTLAVKTLWETCTGISL